MDTTEILATLDCRGLNAALRLLDEAPGTEMLRRLFAADCAERVLPLFEAEFPGNTRPREAIRVARDPNATEEELRAARAAARAAAWAAASAAAWDAERAAQTARLRQYLEHGEAAAQMPWPKETV